MMLYSGAMQTQHRLTEVRDASGVLLGMVMEYVGPACPEITPMFTAVLPDGRPTGESQPTFAAAAAVLTTAKG
jgi:hypothetical protein